MTDRPTPKTLTEIAFDTGRAFGAIEAKVDTLLRLNGIDPDGPEVRAAVEAAQNPTTTEEDTTVTDQTAAFAHPIDEPCPDGCPTRLDEIASYVTECHGAGITVTAETVRKALAAPPETRDDIQRQIAEIATTWA
ncbi:hypothetical protein E1281_25995 [Actinomadura sp. KC345]|nr:hypothetical protein E1281_25995 [Actinomadura sp. KC345]